MTQHQHLSGGFADPVHDAQAAFRNVLDALARPGRRFDLGRPVAGLALGPAMAHLLLALTDDDTPVWWQRPDAASMGWLRFHTGAPLASAPSEAAFAVLLMLQRCLRWFFLRRARWLRLSIRRPCSWK